VTVEFPLQTSANVPSISTRHGPPKKPAKNRQTTNDAKLLDTPAPMMKRLKMGKLMKYTGDRPSRSLRCGVMIGAKAMPTRYSDIGKIAAVIDTLNFAITPEIPGVYAVRPKALVLE